MAEAPNFLSKKRYALVTGANKGIGIQVCRQLASKGIVVVLTSRDEKKGREAVENLKKSSNLSGDILVYHQLDVTDLKSIADFADFVKSQFGKLDILVNNAGTSGVTINSDAMRAAGLNLDEPMPPEIWAKYTNPTYELAEECLTTNYYGAKRMSEALIPLLQLSDSPRIVNVSSFMGGLKYISNEWAKDVLSDTENLTDEKVDEVLKQFLKDFKAGAVEANGWPTLFSAYFVSKAALNANTRIMAKKYPSVYTNSVCPGYIKTDLNPYTGFSTTEYGAENIVRVALMPDGGHSGLFFIQKELASYE